MESNQEDNDVWTGLPTSSGATDFVESRPLLDVEIIDGIEPLGDQIGVATPLSVPSKMSDALFGQPEGFDSDIVVGTYALLDAAKRPGLPEILEASELECTCLFQGAAAQELRDVAPWLVRLEDTHSFTRGLFTHGEGPHQLWGTEPAIYLRSTLSLSDIRKHLRKFTRLLSEADQWHFFRFWEPYYFHVYSDRMTRFPHMQTFWSKVFSDMSVLVPRVATASAIRLQVPRSDRRESVAMSTELRAELKLSVLYRNMIGAAEDLFELHENEARRYGDSPADLWPLLYDFADEVREVGLSDPELRGRMMLLAFLKYHEPWPAFLELPFWQKIRHSPGQANDLFEDFCARLKYQTTRAQSDLQVWW